MANPGDYERTRVTETPDGVRREIYRETEVRRSGTAGWWVAALVALIAVIGLAVLFANQNRQGDLQAARSQGAAQANLDIANADARQAALQASQAAQAAADSTARATQRAAQTAQSAANQTAQQAQAAAASSGDAAQDAATTAPTATPPQQ